MIFSVWGFGTNLTGVNCSVFEECENGSDLQVAFSPQNSLEFHSKLDDAVLKTNIAHGKLIRGWNMSFNHGPCSGIDVSLLIVLFSSLPKHPGNLMVQGEENPSYPFIFGYLEGLYNITPIYN